MALVGLAEASHPELEQPDVVVLPGPSSPQHGQHLLGVLPAPPVHLGELKEHFDLTRKRKERGRDRDKRSLLLIIHSKILEYILFAYTTSM